MRQVNWFAIVLAAVVYFLLQGAWYTVFKDAWLKGIGKTMADFDTSGWAGAPYLIAFVCTLIVAYGLARLAGYLNIKAALGGAKLGVFVWFSFIATTWLAEYAFEQRSVQIFAINAGSSLMGMIVMGLIIGGWQKKGSAPQTSAAGI